MSTIEVKKREGETAGAFLYRFTKRVKQSGILKESKKRRFKTRTVNKGARRASALYRDEKKQEVIRKKKLGYS